MPGEGPFKDHRVFLNRFLIVQALEGACNSTGTVKLHDGSLTALDASLVTWCGTAGPSSCSRPGRSWTGSPAAAGLVVLALVHYHAAHLVVHVVGLPLVPGLEAPGVSAGPLPRALLEVVHPAQPVAVGVVTVHCSSTAVIYALHTALYARVCSRPMMRSCSAWLEGWARNP